MLTTLRRIVQKVDASANLNEALQVMVTSVKKALETESCAFYLIDHREAHYVLMATEGLNRDQVGQLTLNLDAGLIGLVGRREEPINLDDATSHPNFYHCPEAGEGSYNAFLGVPIIHHRHLYGVLSVQQSDKRKYDESEEAFMVTLAAQLAVIIAHAEYTGELLALLPKSEHAQIEEELSLGGMGCVSGVAIGTAVLVYPTADLYAVPKQKTDDIDGELALLDSAITATKKDIQRVTANLSGSVAPGELALFDAYEQMLTDDVLIGEIRARIQEGYWAQWALKKVIKTHIKHFENLEDEYLRERALDIYDLARRILGHLQATSPQQIEYPDKTILIGEEISPAALADVPEGKLVGVVSVKGSANSHVTILARALGAPTVMGAKGANVGSLDGKSMVVDGYYGQVYVNPSVELLDEFKILFDEEKELEEHLAGLVQEPAITPDGHEVKLHVNTGLAFDTSRALRVGAEGIGLYRTEVPFMVHDRFPSEEEQRKNYRQLLKAFSPRQVVMRTLDIGGDKSLPYFPIKDDNPFLGWRGIRVTLDQPEIFLIQVRAMMLASIGLENLSIMLPMISSTEEVDMALKFIHQAFNELKAEGHEIIMPKIGAMIEVPSAVYQANVIAQRVDFISVGSNDLTQYLLAVDRNNAKVAYLYDSFHPAVIKALMQIVQATHGEGKPVSICGEMANHPCGVILLLAMGFDTLSLNSMSLARVKWVIRTISLAKARKLLTEIVQMEHSSMIHMHLEAVLEEAGLGGLLRAGSQ